MSQRQGHERAHGPYRHGNRWRVVFVSAVGASTTESFASIAEANEKIAAYRLATDNRTVAMTADEFMLLIPERGRHVSRYRLANVLPDHNLLVSSVTAPVARKLWNDRASQLGPGDKPLAGATLQSELALVKRWGAWCVERGYLRLNPFAEIECSVPVNRGKPKLRVND